MCKCCESFPSFNRKGRFIETEIHSILLSSFQNSVNRFHNFIITALKTTVVLC